MEANRGGGDRDQRRRRNRKKKGSCGSLLDGWCTGDGPPGPAGVCVGRQAGTGRMDRTKEGKKGEVLSFEKLPF